MSETATITLLFCDLVSSTERLTRLGDEAADTFRRRFFATLRSAIATTGGREIKNLGDGLMVAFERSTIGALSCAATMHRTVSDLDPLDRVQLRIGISVGEVGREEEDWFGTPVVEAARLCAAAEPGQTLATAVVRALVGTRGGRHRFDELSPMRLKGLAAPVAVVSVESMEPVDPASADQPATTTSEHRSRPGSSETIATRPVRASHRVYLAAGAVLVAVAVAAALIWAGRDPGGGGRERIIANANKGRLTRPVGYTPTFKQVACNSSVRSDTPDARCGQLLVPEVRAKPHGHRIHVDVVHVPALGKAVAPPVLLVDVNERLATSPLRDVSDVYDLTLRGFSPTDRPRLVCPELRNVWRSTFAMASDDARALDQRVSAAAECAKTLRHAGVQLEGYTMVEVAADLRDLTIALGLGNVSVASSGFATPAAVQFARDNPGVISSMLLTNPTPPGESTLANPTLDLSKSFDQIVSRCQADPRCTMKFGDLKAMFDQRVEDYTAKPQLVTTVPLGPGEAGVPVLLDGRRMAAALAAALAASSQLPIVPTALTPGGVTPDLLAAAAINQDLHYYAGSDAVGGAALSFFCSYDATMNRTAVVSDAALKEFAGANDPTLQRMCSAWAVPSVFNGLNQPLAGDLPVLLVDGGVSIAGVNGWSDEMAGTLNHATVMHLDTLSEDASYVQPACMRQIRQQFLAHPETKLNVSACEAASPPIEFVGL